MASGGGGATRLFLVVQLRVVVVVLGWRPLGGGIPGCIAVGHGGDWSRCSGGERFHLNVIRDCGREKK